MNRIQKMALPLVALGVSIVALPTAVDARPLGSNGQQAAFVSSCDANWAYITGKNQYNNTVHQWFLVPATTPLNNCQGDDWYDWGWWWKGTVRVDAYWSKGGNYAGTVYAYFPTHQTGDWVWIQMP